MMPLRPRALHYRRHRGPASGDRRMARALIDDCFAHQPDRLTAAQALELLKARVGPVVERESVPLAQAYGRILAEPLVSPRDVPASTTLPSTASRSPMPISRRPAHPPRSSAGRAAAGHPFAGRLAQGGAPSADRRAHARGRRHRADAGGRRAGRRRGHPARREARREPAPRRGRARGRGGAGRRSCARRTSASPPPWGAPCSRFIGRSKSRCRPTGDELREPGARRARRDLRCQSHILFGLPGSRLP